MKTSSLRILSTVSLGLLASLMLTINAAGARIFVATNSTWCYFKGTSEASEPTNAWRELEFDDSSWLAGTAPYHFGTNDVGGDDTLTGGTILSDMRSYYTCLFLRQRFVLEDTNNVRGLWLNVWLDDGLAIWINGQAARNPLSVSGLAYTNTATVSREGSTCYALSLSNAVSLLRLGTNVLCLQVFNRSLTDNDFRIDVELAETPASFALAKAAYTVREDATQLAVQVVRTGDLDSMATVDYVTTNLTAIPGLHYTAVTGTLTFASGETNQTIVVPILNEEFVEGIKTFQVMLSNPSNAVLGTPATATISITDNDTGVQFQSSNYSVAESAGLVLLNVARGNDGTLPVSVDYVTAGLTAIAGVHYQPVSGTLTFAAGEASQAIVVPILNEGLVEGTKTFQVILSNPTNTVLGTPAAGTVSITDNDVGFQFQFASNSVAEDAGTVLLGIVRGDDGTLPVTVDLATTDVTARSGLDYTGITNTLSFSETERFKWVPIPILNDGVRESAKSFRAVLSNPVGATLGSQTTTTVTIVDNDQGFQFEAASYTVDEDAGEALIHVLRGTDNTNSATTVDYATADLTASCGVDYTGVTNTLAFAPGEKIKRIAIPILNDGVRESTKSFRVILNNPSGGAVLGSPATATVNVQDNDPGVGFDFASYSVPRGTTNDLALTVLRGNDGALGPITVDYATSDGTARAGVDYQAASGKLTFQQNETIKSLSIRILRSSSVLSFQVKLSNPSNGAMLGTATTTVTLGQPSATVTPRFDSALAIRRDWGVNVLTWIGGGTLQRADQPTGPWQTLTNARSPYSAAPPMPTAFYRVTHPRLVSLYIPSRYNGQTNLPLVIMLHGYFMNSASYESYMKIQPLAESRGFLYCHPDGLVDPFGYEYWNGTDACCDFYNTGVDDAGYVRALIEEISGRFEVDPKRIHLFGIWMGGYLAYRMACQSADLIAGIASLSGTTFLDPGRCQPAGPVNILHIHGTADDYFSYYGGAVTATSLPSALPSNMPPYPSALRSVEIWAAYNGAQDPVTDSAPSMDLVLDVPGLDTVVMRYTNYPPGGAVELWTINGSGRHAEVTMSADFSPKIIDWLLAHPKP